MKNNFILLLCLMFQITNIIAETDTLKITKKEYEYFYYGKHKLSLTKTKRNHMDELLATTLSDGSAINPIYLIILYNNGLKYKEGLWSALTYTMPYTEYYRNGKIKIVGQFREDGKPMGKWIFYRKNGEIEKEETYNL